MNYLLYLLLFCSDTLTVPGCSDCCSDDCAVYSHDHVFVVMQISMISLGAEGAGMGNIGAFRALRTLRALRPLRAVSRWEGMKVRRLAHTTSIVRSIKKIPVNSQYRMKYFRQGWRHDESVAQNNAASGAIKNSDGPHDAECAKNNLAHCPSGWPAVYLTPDEGYVPCLVSVN